MLRPIVLTTTVLTLLFVQPSFADEIDFTKQIQPIFMNHCSGCHGEEKGAGKLRLHSPEAIQEKWSKDDHLIVKGNPEKSELYERLILPADHKKFMPKKGDPLSTEQLGLIHEWIKQGAAFQVAAQATPAQPAADNHGQHAEKKPASRQTLPLPEVDAADPAAIEKVTAAGGQVHSLYANSSLLQVSFALRSEPATDADLALLAGVAEQVYSLNLAKAQISDKGLASLSQLKNLSKLHLELSSTADSGLSHLSGLPRLEYLNLYGTQITDKGLKSLKGLKQLRKLYVWKTKVSYDAAKAMEKQMAGLAVELGFDHPEVMRRRLKKQLETAKKNNKESEEAFQQAKAAFENAKKNQAASKKALQEVQQKLDVLEGKAKPTQKKTKEESKWDKKA